VLSHRMQHLKATKLLTLRNSDDDSEDETSSDSSSAIAPVARRSKFDDEEDDSDVCIRKHTVHTFPHTHAYIGPRLVGCCRRL